MFNFRVKILDCIFTITFPFMVIITGLLLVDNNYAILQGGFAALIHELGHIFAMILRSCKPKEIQFRAFDINIIDEKESVRTYRDDIFILLAGPMFNILFSGLFYFIYSISGNKTFLFSVSENIFLAVFNMLPIESLDGGQILNSILSIKFKVKTVYLLTTAVSFIVILPIFALGFYILLRSKYNFSLLLLSCYLMSILVLKHSKVDIYRLKFSINKKEK